MKGKNLYLFAVLVIAFLVRLIPSRDFVLSSLDAYVHRDIVRRIVDDGLGIIGSDILAMMGFYAYSYPPAYHVLGAVAYDAIGSDLVFIVLPALFGVGSVYVVYKLAHLLFMDRKAALMSALLFAFAPSLLTRTSVFIPESMGIFLFTCLVYFGAKYVKSIPGSADMDTFEGIGLLKIFRGRFVYLLACFGLLGIYFFTHRGWFILGVLFVILVLTLMLFSLRKKPLLAFALGAGWIIAVLAVSTLSDALVRLGIVPVTVVGYPIWLGLLQFVFGVLGIAYFLKSKDITHRMVAVWAVSFLVISIGLFRFRDPYLTIPLSLIAGHMLMNIVIPRMKSALPRILAPRIGTWRIDERWISGVVVSTMVAIPLIQGLVSAHALTIRPTETELAAFDWILENTPEDATILTLKEDAYWLIGNTGRQDVVLWATVYEGFMGNPQPVSKIRGLNADASTVFRTSRREEAFRLLDQYGVDYIYISKRMYAENIIWHGLGEYMPYDPRFEVVFANGEAALYKFTSDSELMRSSSEELAIDGAFEEIVDFIESHWNGYSYSEEGELTVDGVPGNRIEYRGHFQANAEIIWLYQRIYAQTAHPALGERVDHLYRWLDHKQMESGSFPSMWPPREDVRSTLEVVYPLLGASDPNAIQVGVVTDALDFVERESNVDPIGGGTGFSGSSSELVQVAQMAGMDPEADGNPVENLLDQQRGDGSWSDISRENIAILEGLCRHFEGTGDARVQESIALGAEWLIENKAGHGRFISDSQDSPYSLDVYADALYVFHVAGEQEAAREMMAYIEGSTINGSRNPLTTFLGVLRALESVYGFDKAIAIGADLVNPG